MKLLLIFRLGRIVIHIASGMACCALFFPWLGRDWRNAFIRRWSRQLLRICGVRLELLPGAPVLAHAMVVANHVSWLDIFVVNALSPCRFVAKAEIRSWPMLGWLSAQAGTVYIARSQRRDLRHLFQGLVDKLRAGERIAFFPEGTTAAQGQLQTFHANLFEAAIDADVPVQPFALAYVDQHGQAHGAVDFSGEVTVMQSIVNILSGPTITAQITCLAPLSTAGAHRRDLARAAQTAVAATLGQA